jgi:hypothetical protein
LHFDWLHMGLLLSALLLPIVRPGLLLLLFLLLTLLTLGLLL